MNELKILENAIDIAVAKGCYVKEDIAKILVSLDSLKKQLTPEAKEVKLKPDELIQGKKVPAKNKS